MTNGIEHTPGPWQAEGQKVIKPGGMVHIASTYEGSPEANARLIAAAPELLEALEGLARPCVFIEACGLCGLCDANAVIAKARGKKENRDAD